MSFQFRLLRFSLGAALVISVSTIAHAAAPSQETETAGPGQTAVASKPKQAKARTGGASEASKSTTAVMVDSFSRKAIETIPGGDKAPLNGVLLQASGMAQHSYRSKANETFMEKPDFSFKGLQEKATYQTHAPAYPVLQTPESQ